MNPKWDGRFLELAKFVAQWSKDPKAKVGAVVANKRAGPIALGFNGFPAGVDDSAERLSNTEVKLDMIIHAEQNALLTAGRGAQGGEIFVWGKPVCSRCAGLIIQAGISRVVGVNPKVDKGSKWHETGLRAVEMLKEAKVVVEFPSDGSAS